MVERADNAGDGIVHDQIFCLPIDPSLLKGQRRRVLEASRLRQTNRRPARFAFRFFVLAAVLGAASAHASEAPRDDVARAYAQVLAASGPSRITALRHLWRMWERDDPTHIEQAMEGFRADPSLDPASRAYAGLLSAYARRRRGDLEGAKALVASLGYVNRWLVLGPFDNEGKAGYARVFDPEAQLDQPLDMQHGYEGKERPVRWRVVPDVYSYGWVDLGDLVRPSEKICVYATTFVMAQGSAKQTRPAGLWLGASGAIKAYWNGEEVAADELYRDLDADRVAASVQLKPGWNRLTIKLCGDDRSPMMSVRLADSRGGPDKTLKVSADPALGVEAARNGTAPRALKQSSAPVTLQASGTEGRVIVPREPPKQRRDARSVQGPVQVFDKLVAGKNASASILESYARYLLVTGGDDPSQNLARGFARRAAEQAPSVDRYLLAGKLAEDRNQQRAWVDKALKLPGQKDNIDVVLAQAQLARTGPNWRDAVPFYDRVIAMDPDNLEATLGKVDLHNEAGLRRTALVILQDAVEHNPRSVGLLRALATQLRSLGRVSEAETIEDRYAAYRFDDTTYQVSKIEALVARGDKASAEHWIGRMLGTDPDSAYHMGVAARSYFGLGMPQRALAMYDRALDMAPEDTDTMKALADMFGELGRRGEQGQMLRRVLALRPQFKEIREYAEHIEPPRPRADEAYAWEPDKFLATRNAPGNGFNRRTLRDLQVTTVFPSGLSSVFRQVVFQPLNEEAAASARRYAFAYQADRQTVQLRASRVFRADGRVDEVTETAEGPVDNPSIAMYTSARAYYVEFPRLNVGDVVELRYRIDDITPQNDFADYFGESRTMQSSEPIAHSEYVVIAPKERPLYVKSSPLPGLKGDVTQDKGNNIYRFVASAIAPVMPEPHMPAWSEVLGGVHVSTYRTWDEVGRWYWGLSKDQLVPDDEVRSLVEKLTKGLPDELSKVRAIYGYVVQRTRYVALEFGIYGFRPRRAAQTFSRGWGDCKDKAALIVTMLRVAGIPSSMVLVRSAMRGDGPTEPASLALFDHTIAYVPSLGLYLDGTAEYTGALELPAFDRDSLALVVGDGASKLVHLPDPPAEASRRGRQLEVVLLPNGGANVDMALEASGAFASEWRVRYHTEATRHDRLVGDLSGDLPGFEIQPGASSIEASDLEDIEQPVKMRVRGRAPAFARVEAGKWSVPVSSHARYVPMVASTTARKLDIKLRFKSVVDEAWTVRLPAGMVVKSLPTAASRTSPFGSFELAVAEKDHAVFVQSRVAIARTRIKPTEYPAFLAFCEEMDRVMGQRLSLEKAVASDKR